MAFTYTRIVADRPQKLLRALARLESPNGQTPLTAQQRVDKAVDDLISQAASTVKAANEARQALALAAATPATLATVQSTLAIIPVEDDP